MGEDTAALQGAREELLAETALYIQLENALEAATQCVREYQEILVGLEAAKARRDIADAWIDLGVLAVSLVLTAGGAVYAQGALRGQGLYARFGMTAGERAIAARSTWQAVAAARTPAVRMGKQLAPRFVALGMKEFLPRLAFGASRFALASTTAGPFLVAYAHERNEPNFMTRMSVGKIGAILQVSEKSSLARPFWDRKFRNESMLKFVAGLLLGPEVVLEEDRVVRNFRSRLERIDPGLAHVLEIHPGQWASFITGIDVEVGNAMQKEPRMGRLSDEKKLFVRSRALLDYWERIMRTAEQLCWEQERRVRESAGKVERMETPKHVDPNRFQPGPTAY